MWVRPLYRAEGSSRLRQRSQSLNRGLRPLLLFHFSENVDCPCFFSREQRDRSLPG